MGLQLYNWNQNEDTTVYDQFFLGQCEHALYLTVKNYKL